MSCIDCPRTLSGLCSPSAQRTASVMFDLPQPFGPTITLTPGENSSRVRSGKDLKPLMEIELRCMRGVCGTEGSRECRTDRNCRCRRRGSGVETLERLGGRCLLGRLLRAAG